MKLNFPKDEVLKTLTFIARAIQKTSILPDRKIKLEKFRVWV